MRVAGIEMICKTSGLLGERLTEQLYIERFTQLSKDPVNRIRKTCAHQFAAIAANISQSLLEKSVIKVYTRVNILSK